MTRIRKIGRGLFGVAVLAAMGLGVTQAFAEPASAAQVSAVRACSRFLCHADCKGKGASSGECIGGMCECTL